MEDVGATIEWLEVEKGFFANVPGSVGGKSPCAVRSSSELLLAPEKEWAAVTDLMTCHWRPTKPAETGTGRPHVFIGPAGSGKTTVLCKWMASAVLLNEQSVRVWRMDGESANTSELLTLHCESMGVPVERAWQQRMEMDDLRFVDLPGVEINNHYGISALEGADRAAARTTHSSGAECGLRNARVLFEQFEAFAPVASRRISFSPIWTRNDGA